jgi:hypothetical protein
MNAFHITAFFKGGHYTTINYRTTILSKGEFPVLARSSSQLATSDG